MLKNRLRDITRMGVRTYVIGKKVLDKIKGPPSPAPACRRSTEESAPRSLKASTVVITGSSRGIGFALAEAFAAEGASVVLNGRTSSALAKACEKLRSRHDNVIAVPADVGRHDEAHRLIATALETFGKIDILVNNAGAAGPPGRKIWELEPDEWQSVLSSNLSSAFHCSREVIRWARRSNHRVRIINVSSGIVNYGSPDLGAYTVSKMALEGLTISIAADCPGDDPLVSVVSVKPRSVRTEMTREFFGAPEYILMEPAEAVIPAFLHAATAPSTQIMGKSLSEPAFSADPGAEIALNNRFSTVQPLRPTPEYYEERGRGTRPDYDTTYMHLLQNPAGYYPAVAATVGAEILSRETHGYPDPNYRELRRALSGHHDLDPELFAFGPGSSELLDRALRVLSGPRGKIVITKPTWGWVWPFLLRYGLHPVEVAARGSLKDKNIRHDLEEMLNAISPDTKVLYLVNPCNPTGSVLDKQTMGEFLRAVPAHVSVILDEAYIDYCEPDKRFDLVAHLDDLRCRIVALRTFSKFYAMAGFRIGYAYGKPDFINFLDRAEVPFNVSNIAQVAALAALNDRESRAATYRDNDAERNRIGKALDTLDIAFMPTQTNFILFECPLEKTRMRNLLRQDGIFMPNVDQAFVENYALMTVGRPAHNQKILDLLARY